MAEAEAVEGANSGAKQSKNMINVAQISTAGQ